MNWFGKGAKKWNAESGNPENLLAVGRTAGSGKGGQRGRVGNAFFAFVWTLLEGN